MSVFRYETLSPINIVLDINHLCHKNPLAVPLTFLKCFVPLSFIKLSHKNPLFPELKFIHYLLEGLIPLSSTSQFLSRVI